MANILDLSARREIADGQWQLFALICRSVSMSFDSDGVTIRAQFKEPVDLDGEHIIVGVTHGFREYDEVKIPAR